MDNNGYTPPSKNNPFRSGDVVIKNGVANVRLIVDHVESNRVFCKPEIDNRPKKRLYDFSSAELMLLSDWQRIYGAKNA